MAFRFAAKNAFLTYPRAEAIESKDALLQFLLGVGNASKVLVAKELHEDGGIHYHACVEFPRKFQSRDVRVFDFMGCHPNIDCPRSLKSVLIYCIKEGDYINHRFIIQDAKSMVDHCIEESVKHPSVDDAVVAVVKAVGDKGLKNINQIESFLRMLMKDKVAYDPMHVFPDEFHLVASNGERVTWADAAERFHTNVILPSPLGVRDQFTKSLWIYGPSQMGKTHLARSFGRHWYMQSQWNAERLDATAEYGVMDDIEWPSMRFNYKGMLGHQVDVTVTDKYRRKSVYRGGLGVVVVSNELPTFTEEEWAWLEVNVEFVYINYPVHKQ
nr:MAG: replication polyprotein [Crogonang virus 140]